MQFVQAHYFILYMQIQAHESSVLEFRVFGKSKLFEDSLIGQKILKISHAIKKESDNGKCKHTMTFLQIYSSVYFRISIISAHSNNSQCHCDL